eukprot:363781-Chlamydomonas_euryale.AAC.15
MPVPVGSGLLTPRNTCAHVFCGPGTMLPRVGLLGRGGFHRGGQITCIRRLVCASLLSLLTCLRAPPPTPSQRITHAPA